MSHLAERFAEAVRTLVSDGPIKQRLSRAYADNLEGIDQADLPPAVRHEFGDLTAALTRIAPAGNETRVRANVQKMSPSEAGEHAITIVKLYVELVGQVGRAEPLKVVTSGSKAPRYLSSRP
jgi:hypothetical protein